MAEAAAAQELCSAASCFVLWGPTAPQPHEMGNSPLPMCGREDLSARCLGQRWQEKIWYHARFRDLTLPQRSTKPARELIFLRKPSHFRPAIWSVKQGMGNGWVIPKGHQPSSQTYFSNVLHFNVHVGIPAKLTFLGSCSSIPGTWQRGTQWCWRCSGVPQANRQCEILGKNAANARPR